MDNTMYKTLTQLGISPSLKGFFEIDECVNELKKDINAKITGVYVTVARKTGSTWHRVERNIRHAVQISLSRGDLPLIRRMFGYVVDSEGRLTNSEFLKCLTMYLNGGSTNG